MLRSAVELANCIASGDVSAREVLAAHLDQIQEHNAELNAIVAMFPTEELFAEADRIDAFDKPVGPLHGLPIAIKDLEDVAGLPTSLGSLSAPTTPAVADGIVASRLRAAGALIIGKTNTPEFGTGSQTFNEVYGATRNPWDTARTPGGSSGGAAAALASFMLPIADGSDLGGSLRNPAALSGVVGLRPSIGRVSEPDTKSGYLTRLGLSGPMGRSVADAALGLEALAVHDRSDPMSLPIPDGGFVTRRDPGQIRVGWLGDTGQFTCESDVLTVSRTAAEQITAIGGSIQEATIDLSYAMDIFRVLRGLAYRGLGVMAPPEAQALFKDTVKENIAFGLSLTLDDAIRADALRADLQREITAAFEHFDVLALPTTQVTAFPVEVEYPTEIEGVAMGDYLDWMQSCCVITPTGCPAISIPAGLDSNGLPVGLQLVAPIGEEARLLDIASAMEAAISFPALSRLLASSA